ncbi:hypothetical protein DICPUDRAFT_14334, partial [Dictyostelium purpureum]
FKMNSIEINSQDDRNKVAVIGYGFRLPKNSNPEELFNTLKNGIDCIDNAVDKRWAKTYNDLGYIKTQYAGLVDLETEWKKFDPLFFGINPTEAPTIDCQQRVLMKTIYEAFENAHIDPTKLRGSNTSVFVGASTADFQSQFNLDIHKHVNLFNNNLHTISNRISYCFDFRGASLSIDTACSSSLNAVLLGYKSIVDGESELSVAGGCNLILDPTSTKTASYLGILGTSGKCKSFDEDADGFIRAEGAGCVILKRLSSAIRDGDRVYCVINGGSSNVDGNFNKNSLFSPSKLSQYQNILSSLKSSNIHPSDIRFVECHGTGTKVGDPIECEAISMIFKDHFTKDNPLYIGTIKSNLGHCETVSGVASLIKCCLMFQHKQLLPNINFKTPNSNILFEEWKLKVVTESIPFESISSDRGSCKPISMVINNFGVTGSNCCLVLTEYSNEHLSNGDKENDIDGANSMEDSEKEYLLPFSANSKRSLEMYHFKLYNSLILNNIKVLDLIKHQIYSKSLSFPQRDVVVFKDWSSLKSITLNEPNENMTEKPTTIKKVVTENNKSSNLSTDIKNPPLVFVFSGQGSHSNKMGLELYNKDKIFKESIDNVDNMLMKYYGYSILEKLRSIADDDLFSINDPLIAQPSIFMIQVSLFNLYKHWGIHPLVLVGHSFGEVTASYCSGIISLDTACYIIYERSRLQHKTIGSGRMLSISIGEQEFKDEYSSQYPSIEISCYNSPSSIVISGKESELVEISNKLKEKEIFCAMLGTHASYHTSSQEMIKDELFNINKYEFNELPNIATFSTVSGNQFDIDQQFNKEYLYDNLRKPVLFSKAISNIMEYIKSNNLGSNPVFLEISPHPVLSYYLKQIAYDFCNDEEIYFSKSSIAFISSLNKNKSDIQEIQTTISKVYCSGYSVDFTCQFTDSEKKDLTFKLHTDSLPHYQFDEKDYWFENKTFLRRRLEGPSNSQLGIENDSSPFISRMAVIDLKNEPFQFYKNHQVKNKYFLPGCSYISNILSLFKGKDINITQLEFKTPLILTEGSSKYLQTNIYKTSRNEFKVHFHFKDDIDSERWIQTSTGKILQLDHSETVVNHKYNIKELKAQCNYTSLKKFELYMQIKAQTCLGYSGCFQRVEKCYIGQNKTLTKVALHPPNSQVDNQHFFSPSILDSCLHGMVGGFDGFSQIVFDRVEDYKVYSKNIPETRDDHTHIYVYSESEKRVGDSFFSSVLIMLKDGTPLIEASRIVCTSLTPIRDNLNIEYPYKSFFTFNFQPKDSQIKIQDFDANEPIGKIIKNSLEPISNQKYVVRILEIYNEIIKENEGDNNQNQNEKEKEKENEIEKEKEMDNILNESILKTQNILEQINSLYENELFELDIEYTLTNIQEDFKRDIKNKLSFFKGSLLFKTIEINEPIIQTFNPQKEYSINPSYYDFILLSSDLNSINSLKSTLSELYKLSTPNGKLIIPKGITLDDESVNDQLESTACQVGFINNRDQNNSNVILLEKPTITNQILNNNQLPFYDQVIIFGECSSQISTNFKSKIISAYSSNNSKIIKEIKTIEDFNSHIISNPPSDNSVIYFISTIDQVTVDNFKKITLDYVNINQYLVKENKTIKHILVTTYSEKESKNYLAGSVVGGMTFFHEVQPLLFLIDFDNESIEASNVIETIETLIDPSSNIQREYIIRNNIAYFERAKLEKYTPTKFKSTTYQNQDNLYARLDSNLEYQLDSKDPLLEDSIEVEVKAVGINFKDNLIYRGLVPPELRSSKGDIHKPEFGLDCSGIVTRVGSNVTEFKIGDEVFGPTRNATSSTIIDDKCKFLIKPSCISFTQAASIPSVYLTCLYSFLKVGHLSIKNKDTVLIHSATGGVGLSAINILKFLGFNSYLFVTVSSKEKEEYLRNTYGDFITGIYSSKDSHFERKIKEKLKQLGSKKTGVDILLNTLSNEFLDANFRVIAPMGRFIDLSVTHLNIHEYTDFNKFKWNISYHNIELTSIPPEILLKLMKKLLNGLESNQLDLIPINEYSVSNIKDAIEFIGERKNIGKIVINIDQDLITPLLEKKNKSNQIILQPPNEYRIDPQSLGETILVTGQGGLIFEVMKWISKYSDSVKHIIVLSKSELKWELKYLINKIKNEQDGKIKFYFKSVDVSIIDDLEGAIDSIYNENPTIPPIDVVFHFAFSYTNVFEPKFINMDHIEISHAAKTMGALNLHNISVKRNWKLKNFVTTSSVASAFGSTNQMGYVSANSVLDALGRYRKSIGLPIMNVNWGLVGSAGIITKQVSIASLLEGQGISNIPCNVFLGSIDLLLQNPTYCADLMIHNFNFDALENNAWPYKQIKYKYDYLFNAVQSRKKLFNKNESSIRDELINKIAESLSIEPSRLNLDSRIIDFGFDSLAVVQFKNWLDKNYAENLFTIIQLQNLTINQIIQTIINKVNNNGTDKKNYQNSNSNNFKPTITFSKTLIDWESEILLDGDIKSNKDGLMKSIESISSPLKILLTGCTGNIGSHLLEKLLKVENCETIFCLVRNVKNSLEADQKIQTTLKNYDQINEKDRKKIIPVIGDLDKQNLGLSDSEYQHLAKSVQIIINLASNNNFNSAYDECKETNVQGVREIIKISASSSFKRIIHITPSFLSFNQNIFDTDQQLPIFSNEQNNFSGYLNSKSVSEHLIQQYSTQCDVPCLILRSPFIISTSSNNNLMYSLIESCILTGSYPINVNFKTNTAPINWLSESIINTVFNDN